MEISRRIERACQHPRLIPAAALLAAGLCLPALGVGYQIDDWMHQAILAGAEPGGPQRAALTELFAFAEPGRNAALRELGLLPWWAPEDLLVRLWRPLSAATHLLDHRLLPGGAWLAHLHSLGWLAALVAAAGLLLRRVLGAGAAAGLAALLYAVDEAHGIPAGWLANRNALIAGALGIGALLAYDRYRREGWAPGAALCPMALAAALGAGESAVAVAGWLLSYALFLDGGSLPRRLGRLLPAAAVVLGWRLLYTWLGYGARGSGLYIDPVAEPWAFARALPPRALVLAADQLLSVPSAAYVFVPPSARGPILLGCAAGVIAALAAGWRVLAGSRRAGFLALGSALSLLPIAATFPAARLLVFVGLGGAGLLALIVERTLWRGRAAAWVSGLLALHLALAPALLAAASAAPLAAGGLLFKPCEEVLPEQLEGRTVVYVNANELCAGYAAYERAVEGRPLPRAVRLLASGLYDVELLGVDAHTLELRLSAGMQSTAADTLMRSADVPLPLGGTEVLGGVRITALGRAPGGGVDHLRVRFDVPLGDPSLIWVAARGGGAVIIEPPEPGQRTLLPRVL